MAVVLLVLALRMELPEPVKFPHAATNGTKEFTGRYFVGRRVSKSVFELPKANNVGGIQDESKPEPESQPKPRPAAAGQSARPATQARPAATGWPEARPAAAGWPEARPTRPAGPEPLTRCNTM